MHVDHHNSLRFYNMIIYKLQQQRSREEISLDSLKAIESSKLENT